MINMDQGHLGRYGKGQEGEGLQVRKGKDLCAGWPHSTARNLDVKATLGVFLSTEGRVVVRLTASFPVTDCLPNGLQDTAITQDNSQASS